MKARSQKPEARSRKQKAESGKRCQIEIVNQSGRQVPLDRGGVQTMIDLACSAAKLKNCSLTVTLVDSATSAKLHKQHFNVAGATDVMTFPDGSPDPESGRVHLGDLAVCPEVAKAAAKEHGLEESDEITLYILHGLLHLTGYDDDTDQAAKAMWNAQRRFMREIGVKLGAKP